MQSGRNRDSIGAMHLDAIQRTTNRYQPEGEASSTPDLPEPIPYVENLGVDHTKKLLMLVLASLASKAGTPVVINDAKFERLTSLRAPTIRRHVNQLEQLGLLKIIQRQRREYALDLTYAEPTQVEEVQSPRGSEAEDLDLECVEPGERTDQQTGPVLDELQGNGHPGQPPQPQHLLDDAPEDEPRLRPYPRTAKHSRTARATFEMPASQRPASPLLPGVTRGPLIVLAAVCLLLLPVSLGLSSPPMTIVALGCLGLVAIGTSAIAAGRGKSTLAVIASRSGWFSVATTAALLVLRTT